MSISTRTHARARAHAEGEGGLQFVCFFFKLGFGLSENGCELNWKETVQSFYHRPLDLRFKTCKSGRTSRLCFPEKGLATSRLVHASTPGRIVHSLLSTASYPSASRRGPLPHLYRTLPVPQAPTFRSPRNRLQYSTGQMAAAIADVDQGKPVRSAAKEHGIPLRSLYHKLKMRSTSTQKTLVSLRDKSDFADEEELVTVQFHENLPSSPDADSN